MTLASFTAICTIYASYASNFFSSLRSETRSFGWLLSPKHLPQVTILIFNLTNLGTGIFFFFQIGVIHVVGLRCEKWWWQQTLITKMQWGDRVKQKAINHPAKCSLTLLLWIRTCLSVVFQQRRFEKKWEKKAFSGTNLDSVLILSRNKRLQPGKDKDVCQR